MASKATPQERWAEKNGIKAKAYKLNAKMADEFKATCARLGVSQSAQLTKMMQEFIEQNKEK